MILASFTPLSWGWYPVVYSPSERLVVGSNELSLETVLSAVIDAVTPGDDFDCSLLVNTVLTWIGDDLHASR